MNNLLAIVTAMTFSASSVMHALALLRRNLQIY